MPIKPFDEEVLDQDMLRVVLAEQKMKRARLMIDIKFIDEKFSTSTTFIERRKKLQQEIGVIDKFIGFIESKIIFLEPMEPVSNEE